MGSLVGCFASGFGSSLNTKYGCKWFLMVFGMFFIFLMFTMEYQGIDFDALSQKRQRHGCFMMFPCFSPNFLEMPVENEVLH